METSLFSVRTNWACWTTFTLTILSNKKIKRKEQIKINGVSVDKFSKITQKNENQERPMFSSLQVGNFFDN